jgi:NADH-quinone oxidoreductase subunit E
LKFKNRLITVGSSSVANTVFNNHRRISPSFREKEEKLIPLLQKFQATHGYLSNGAIEEVACHTQISKNKIYGVASFYSQFRFTPPGEHIIKVCLGTACHVRGGESLLEIIKRKLSISPGETTKDGKFSLERVACLGCCALAPVMVIDNNVYGRMDSIKVKKILTEYISPKRYVEPIQQVVKSGGTKR